MGKIRLDTRRGGERPGGIGAFLFKLWRGFLRCPVAKTVLTGFQFCMRYANVKKIFMRRKNVEDLKFGRKDIRKGGKRN
jgi:hypothetical protein